MSILAICPNFSHPDYIKAEEAFGVDRALLLFDRLGGRIPSEAEIEVIQKKGKLSPNHNQRAWDVRKAEKLNTDKWSMIWNDDYTHKLKYVEPKTYHKNKAQELVDRLNNHRPKYTNDGFKFVVNFDSRKISKAGGAYIVDVIDTRFVENQDLSNFHAVRNEQRAEIAAEDVAHNTEVQSAPFKDETNTETQLPVSTVQTAFNKQDIVNELINQLDPEVQDIMRNELTSMSKDEFEKYAKQAGYNSVGTHWVLGNVQNEQSRRLKGVNQQKGTREQAEEQITIFQKAIPYVEKVIFDSTLMTIAQADAGGRTIRVNPELLTKDAIGHEFGHILIDILGGMSNSMIAKGRAQLHGTDIETAVLDAYPDLVSKKDERIDKEILATSIGMDVAKIFKEQEQQNTWMRWLIRFFRALRSKLGIEASVSRQLAEKLVSGTQVSTKERATVREVKTGLYVQGRPSAYVQHSKDLSKSMTLLDKMITKEEEFQKKGTLALQKKLDVLAKQGKDTKEYKALEDMLPRMQNANPTKGIIQMIRFAVESTKQMNDTYISYEAQAHGKGPERNQGQNYTAKLLAEWRTSVAAWDMLEDLKTMLVGTRDEVAAFGEASDLKALQKLLTENKDLLTHIIDPKVFKQHITNKDNIIDMLLPLLNHAIDVKNTMQRLYIEKGKELMVDFLFPYVKHVEVMKREEYEKEWLAFDDKKRAETPMEKYVMDKMIANKSTIENDTRDLILRELGKAEGDIGFLTRYVDTILDSKDVISSALARTVFGIHEATRKESLEYYYKFLDVLTPLEKQLGRTAGMADEKFWDWILETDPKTGRPTQKIISEVPSQLIDDFEAYKQMVMSENYQTNEGKKPSDDAKRKLVRDWMENNAKVDKEALIAAQTTFINTLYERGIVTDKERKRWIRNSKVSYKGSKAPLHEIFKNQEAVDEVSRFNRNNYWNFRTLSPFYKSLNKKWDALEAMRKNGIKNGKQTDARIVFYDFLQDVIDEAAIRLPGKYALYNDLPSMMKQAGQRYRSTQVNGMSKVDFLKQELRSKFTKRASDTDRGMLDDEGLNIIGKEEKAAAETDGAKGVEKTMLVNEANEPVYFLPIYYTQNLAKDKGHRMAVEDQSFDIASLYFNYMKMAIDFGNKSKVLAELEMTNYFINNREVISRDSDGNIHIDATAKKMKRIGDKIRDKAITTSGRNSMLAAQVSDFMKMSIYGMEKDEEPDINVFGFSVDRAKLLDAMNGFTALNLLGMNFVAGIANVNLGEITQVIESMAGQYVTIKNLKDATGYYYKNLGGILTDIGARRPRNIVTLLNDRFDTLNEEIDGQINLNSRFANLMKTNTLFFTSHSGEHYMQTRFMLAMLKNVKAYDAESNDLGDMLSQYSIDEETNQLKLNDKVANFGEKEQIDFSAKMHRVLASMHGEYTPLGKSSLQRTALGRMGILFRRFVVPGFKRRWQGRDRDNRLDGINNLLGDYQEGYYRTFGHFAKLMMKDLITLKFEAIRAHGRTMTKQEKANLVRFTSEMAFFLTSIIIASLALRAKSDDPDKDDVLMNNIAYQALRLRSELSFFFNPVSTMQILRSPMAAMSQLETAIKLFGQLTYPITTGKFELEVYQNGAWKDHYKISKTMNDLLPVFPKQYYRVKDIGDMLSFFQQ